MKILHIASVIFLASLPVSARDAAQNNQPQGMDTIRTLISSRAVSKIRVLHVPDSTLTTVSVSPSTLRSLAHIDKTFSDRIEETFDPVLSGVSAKNVGHKADLRWGVFLYDAQNQEIGSFFVDKFGQYGYVNDQPVSFETGTFARNLAKRLHKITGVRD
jgi:hypothetical protein